MKAKVIELKQHALSSMTNLFSQQAIGKVKSKDPFHTMTEGIENYFAREKSHVDQKLVEDLLVNGHLSQMVVHYKEELQEKLDLIVVKVIVEYIFY